jgi:uncharacterized protein (TIGR02270 family)
MTQHLARQPIVTVVQQHAEESAMLRHVRSVLVRAPHVRLRQLRRLDDRIAAHLDGLAVAGATGTALCTAALERPGAGEVFARAVRAIDERDEAWLDRLAALAATLPDARRGLLSAFGWVSAAQLQGIVRSLLASGDATRRDLAIGACRLHGVDPGPVLRDALRDTQPAALRASAWRAAGDLGRTDLLDAAVGAIDDPAEEVAWHATVAAAMLGDRTRVPQALEAAAQRDGPWRDEAVHWLMLVTGIERGREFLRVLAKAQVPEAVRKRRVIRACGLLGDTGYVPWLVETMKEEPLSRIAGESFSMITGADLAALDLERKPPEGVRNGPTDDPDDDDVAMDEDESLPWPDPEQVQRWWQSHAATLPAGVRCFMGAQPGSAECVRVLREGFQRQRIVAARHQVLLSPGVKLFPVCAPAWRQQRLLAAGPE